MFASSHETDLYLETVVMVMMMMSFVITRVRTDPGKSWNFIVQNSRLWKVLEKGIGPGKAWKVLEL